eukprot:EG_transcript_14515
MLSLARRLPALPLAAALPAGGRARSAGPTRSPPLLALPPRCRGAEQYAEVMARALGDVEEAVAQWLPTRLQGRVTPRLEKELLRWWQAIQPTAEGDAAAEGAAVPLSLLHRLALCHTVARTGMFRAAFRHQLVSLPGQPVALVTRCPLEHFARQASRHSALCDLRLFAAFYGFAAPRELQLAVHRTLVRSLALPNADARAGLDAQAEPDLDIPQLKPVHLTPRPGPALFSFRPGSCDWVLLHVFEDRPTVSLIAFANANRYLRAAQLPSEDELLGLQGAARRRYGLAAAQEVVVNHVLLPPDGLDQTSLLRLHRLLGAFPPPVERFWAQFDRPTPQDVDLEAWRSIDERDAWLTRL